MKKDYLNEFSIYDCEEFAKKRVSVILGDGVIVAILGINEDPHDAIISRERRLSNEAG